MVICVHLFDFNWRSHSIPRNSHRRASRSSEKKGAKKNHRWAGGLASEVLIGSLRIISALFSILCSLYCIFFNRNMLCFSTDRLLIYIELTKEFKRARNESIIINTGLETDDCLLDVFVLFSGTPHRRLAREVILHRERKRRAKGDDQAAQMTS